MGGEGDQIKAPPITIAPRKTKNSEKGK